MFRNYRLALPIVWAMACAPFGNVLAEETSALPAGCMEKDRSSFVVVLICPAEASGDALAQAGQAACGAQRPCGAWIWSNAKDAPTEAPANHDALTSEQVTSSRGVWVAESGSFITIDEVEQ